MKRYIVTFMLLCTLVSCGGMAAKVLTSAVKPSSGLSVDTSLNGEAKNQIIGQKQETDKRVKTGDNAKITQNETKTINKSVNVPSWLILVACLAVPDPYTLTKGLIKIIKLIRDAFRK